jgi:RHS repeat-associated protein
LRRAVELVVGVRRVRVGGNPSLATYDAFGNQSASPTTYDTDAADSFGAQWGYFAENTGTGLELLGHRYYDPANGRFINRDPICYNGGFDLYSYVDDNPTDFIDAAGYDAGAPWPTFQVPLPGDYGTHCGAYRHGPRTRKEDPIDQCCLAHDNCIDDAYCRGKGIAEIWSLRKVCDYKLCSCAMGAESKCNTWQCQVEAGMIQFWFCALPIGSGPPNPLDPRIH